MGVGPSDSSVNVCVSLSGMTHLVFAVPPVVDESGLVRVDFVYEPPQQGSADQLLMERHTAEETQVRHRQCKIGCSEALFMLLSFLARLF